MKDEKKGLRTVMIIYAIAWSSLMIGNPIIGLIGFVTLGILGFTLWRLMEGIIERGEENPNGR